MNIFSIPLLTGCLLIGQALAQGERVPIPAEPSEAFVEHIFYAGRKARLENLEVEYVALPRETEEQKDSRKGRARPRVAWEIMLVDAESGLPIERRFINTRRTMLCGTGYVPWYDYRNSSGGAIVLTGPDGVARFDGALPEREHIDIYGGLAKCGETAVSYQRAKLSLPQGKRGFLGKVTVRQYPLAAERQQLWVFDGSSGRGLSGAGISAALHWESFAVGQGVGLDEAPRVLLGTTGAKGSVDVSMEKDGGHWFIAEAPGYAPKWFWAYDKEWQDGYADWSGHRRRKGAKELVWPKRLEVQLERAGSISGEVSVGPTVSPGALSIVVDWKVESMFDPGGAPGMSVRTAKRKPKFEVRSSIGPGGRFRVDGIPPGVPLRIRVAGDNILHETVDPIEINPGEQKVWNWSTQDGVGLKLSLPERWTSVELFSAPNELPGWAPLPANLFLYSGSVPVVYGRWTEAIPQHLSEGQTLRWLGLAPGRYVLKFTGQDPENDGHRTLVLDLESDHTVTMPPETPCTFLLPIGEYTENLQLRAVNAETGEWFLGGKDLAGCEWTEGRLSMWMPDGEYYLALSYKNPDGCRKVYGKFPVRSGGCIDLASADMNGGGRFGVYFRVTERVMKNQDRVPERIPLGTVYRGNEPVMGVWMDARKPYSTGVVGLPAGDYEFHPLSGQPHVFTLEKQKRVQLQLPEIPNAR